MSAARPHVVMVAAENDALPGGKIGGIGDVVRDAAPALAGGGVDVSVLTPAYGVYASLAGARPVATVHPTFAGRTLRVDLVEVPGRVEHEGVRHLVLDHPGFSACGAGRIYCDDPPDRPFETDASKFALFCAAVAAALEAGALGHVDVVHLHDWHAALTAILLTHEDAAPELRDLRRVFTIHNLALQGVRPLDGHPSSLAAWFPDIRIARASVADPRWPDCVNPMATGIRLADAVHVVSPTYAEEIRRPSAVERAGVHGGEGLEADLELAHRDGRLFGILNGCEYPADDAGDAAGPGWTALRALMRAEILRWASADRTLSTVHFVAGARVDSLAAERPGMVVTFVGRLTPQKVGLLRAETGDGRPALEHVLERLAGDGVLLLLGSGDPVLEQQFTEASARHENLIFLRGYSDALARALYAAGDLFLMPSSFEPCGIGQMLAMRAGQPCLVHHVGGLRDTVADGETGFAFSGDGRAAQADALARRFDEVLALRARDPRGYAAIAAAARARRFEWSTSIAAYRRDLYGLEEAAQSP